MLSAAEYHNPIISGFAPDPSICRVGDDYYLANSSFTMYPGVPIYHSRDLVHWQLITYALTRPDQLELRTAGTQSGIWAPTLRYHNGTFFMIVKNQAISENLYVTATNITGPWSPAHIIAGWGIGIDPDLFFDADGKAYVTKTEQIDNQVNTTFRTWEIDLATGKLNPNPRVVWDGSLHKFEEGPHIYRIGNYYYQLRAEGGTWNNHQVAIARRPVSEGLGDKSSDWEPCPHNPILFNDPAKKPEINTTGHGDLVQDQRGKWWMVFLCNSRTPKPDLGRETCLAPVEWQDGWPVVNGGRLITHRMTADTLPSQPWPAPAIRDDFTNATLGLEWNFLRNPKAETWSLSERPGWLTLHGMKGVLADKTPLAWVGRRLRDKQMAATTRVDFTPGKEGLAAGLDIFSQTSDHAELIVRRHGGGRQVVVRYRSSRDVAVADAPGNEPVRLQLLLQSENLFFRYSTDEGKTWQTLLDGPIDQIVGYPGFAGMYVAMHATGEGAAARFDWFDYEPLAQPIAAAHAAKQMALLDKNGFKRIEAEDFDQRSGTDIESCDEGGLDVCRTHNGNSLIYENVHFASAPRTFSARVASQAKSGRLEVRLDRADGTLLGTCDVPVTGGGQNWTTVQCPLTNAPAGPQRLCLCIAGAGRPLFNLNWFQFNPSPATQP